MNKYYRERTEEEVQRKIDKLKTSFMVNRIMNPTFTGRIGEDIKRILRRMSRRTYRELSRTARNRIGTPEVVKIKRLERKLRRMKEGKWRKRNAI